MKQKIYTSSLTREQFKRLEPLLPLAKSGGRPRTVEMFEIISAILYVLRNACVWRDLLNDFPKCLDPKTHLTGRVAGKPSTPTSNVLNVVVLGLPSIVFLYEKLEKPVVETLNRVLQ